MSVHEPAIVAETADEEDPDLGAELTDDELDALLLREITIDGMCGVY